MLGSFFHRHLERRAAALLKRWGFEETASAYPCDVLFAGYPKSGNTWLQFLVCNIVYGINPQYAEIGLIDVVVPDVHAYRFYRRVGSTCFFKSHELPGRFHGKVVYIVRDGRDVMVSYYHMLVNMGKPVDWHELVINGEGLFPCTWADHVSAWHNWCRDNQALVIRYEDLHEEPVSTLQKLCFFLEIERDDEVLERAVDLCCFDRLRSDESRLAGKQKKRVSQGNFFRRGQIGAYKDEMADELTRLFEEQAGRELELFGYLPSTGY